MPRRDILTASIRSRRKPRESLVPPSSEAMSPREYINCSGVSSMPNSLLSYGLRTEGIAISITLALAQVIVIAAFLGSIAGFLGGIHHYLELISHFKLQYLIIALACLLLFVALHAWWSALTTSFIILLNLVIVLPYYIPQSKIHLKEPHYPMKLLFANVESKNKNFSGFISYVIEENPDVLIIQEATELWINRLQALEERFPYNKALPRPWSVGIALYSRLPVAAIRGDYARK